MKNFVFIFLLLPVMAMAQTKPLFIEGSNADIFLKHTTGPKESFYSIGRIYNISPKIMAPYNNLILEKGLTIGQVVKIPLNDVNFTQDGTVAEDEALIPLYYKTKAKGTVGSVAAKYNVSAGTLKKWNKVNSDAVAAGTNMVIGYLKVKKELSPLAGQGVKVQPIVQPVKIEAEEGLVVKIESVKSDPVKKEEIKSPSSKSPEPAKPEVKNTEEAKRGNGGVFKSAFRNSAGIEERGLAGTFKSTSGWEDGKYYCLHNTAPAGTIIRITNPVNQRSVYAKVLDVIPDLKQNEGMILRLSNAAAEELGAITDNFQCTLNF